MKYLLDTNAVIELLAGNAHINARARRETPADVVISSIVSHELYFGACKSLRRESNLARVDALLFETLDFDKEDSRAAGEIRAGLALRGQSIGPYDVLIAGQALARGLVLVTHNTGEFSRVAGLAVEDWQIPSS